MRHHAVLPRVQATSAPFPEVKLRLEDTRDKEEERKLRTTIGVRDAVHCRGDTGVTNRNGAHGRQDSEECGDDTCL